MPEKPIITLVDWNQRLGITGCCEMPACPVPVMECEVAEQPQGACGYEMPILEGMTGDDLNPCRRFHRVEFVYEEVEVQQTTRHFTVPTATTKVANNGHTISKGNVHEKSILEGVCSSRFVSSYYDGIAESDKQAGFDDIIFYTPANDISSITEQHSSSDGTTCSGTTFGSDTDGGTTTSWGPVAWNFCDEAFPIPDAAWTYLGAGVFQLEELTDLTAFGAEEDATYDNVTWSITRTYTVTYSDEADPDENPIGEYVTDSVCTALNDACESRWHDRFKWVIPDDFTGSYFKITWDYVTVKASDSSKEYSLDHTWEWAGPGNPADVDSWKSPYFNIPMPPYPGECFVRNIRFVCYHAGVYGVKPQTTGIADPPP